MRMLEETNRIKTLISRWVAEIKAHNAEYFYDINKISENFALQLLNLIFDYQLRDLNEIKANFPAVGLGDFKEGIAFQVTSRGDIAKIQKDLQTFKNHGLKEQFPNGMRFFMVNFDKKKWSPEQKEKSTRQLAGFDADAHIINCSDLVGEIEKIYNQYSEGDRFRAIETLLEREFGDEKRGPSLLRLLSGSRRYYKNLTGPTGRFRHLHIEDLILTRPKEKRKMEWIPQPVTLTGEGTSRETILDVPVRLWDKANKHAVIVGEGGMGKTVSLVRLWQTLLDRCGGFTEGQTGLVPVFIALNEYNQPRLAADFIVNAICKNYLGSTVTAEELWNLLKTPPEPIPFLVLLLDGFNEITVDKQELLLEINRLLEQAPGVQLIFTSRFDMRFHQQWQDFNLLQLQKLEEKQIEDYLQSRGIPCPAGRLKELVANPMMLTLYAASCDVVKMHGESVYCDFKKEVETPGELLWNFIEAQVAILPERLAKDRAKITLYGFLLKFLLPGLGFEMERAGLFYFSLEQLNAHVDVCCRRFGGEDFFAAFPEYEVLEEGPWLGECETGKAKRKRQRDVRDILAEELLMLVVEDGAYRFLHQDFRDYFAAVHVWNELQMGLKEQAVPALLREGALSFFVRRFLGEIDGQHRVRHYLVEGEGWRFIEKKDALLYKALELCRGDFSGDMGFVVWNIVETWKEVRGDLSGADLSRLDLSRVNFNSVVCSRSYEEKHVAAVFNESLLHAANLFPQGHSSNVTSAVYSGDGKKVLSASEDKPIKEWDAATGQCLKTLKGNSGPVYSAIYSSDGIKILSASGDGTIKEWDAASGECLRTLKGHTRGVASAVYSDDGKKILSASNDNTIKEWDAATGQCLRTLKGHYASVSSTVYSSDGKKILSASWDHTIKEWDAVTGQCLRTLKGHNYCVLSAVYSVDGKKILSASSDRTVKEWDAQSGQCLETYVGSSSDFLEAQNIRQGNNILERDNTIIKIKNASTGEVLKTLIDIPGLWVQSCSFADLHPDCRLSAEELELLKMYGAVKAEKKVRS